MTAARSHGYSLSGRCMMCSSRRIMGCPWVDHDSMKTAASVSFTTYPASSQSSTQRSRRESFARIGSQTPWPSGSHESSSSQLGGIT
eukprot:scaffold126014_cov35-Tisochrysis_lutea.AAC.3